MVEGSYPNSPAVRCAYLTNGAVLIGLTLTNGYVSSSDVGTNEGGGGVWCQSPAATLLNCAILGNYATRYGGGAYSGALIDCVLSNNVSLNVGAYGGGCFGSILTNCLLAYNRASYGGGGSSNVFVNCTLVQNESLGPYPGGGGGAYASVLNNCILSGNEATNGNVGGGALNCTLTNCILTGNSATNGGGAAYGLLVNCVLTNNAAYYGGGACSNALNNCTLIFNRATFGGGACGGVLNDCLIFTNTAGYYGGGTELAADNFCDLFNNSAAVGGGGAVGGSLTSCIISNNVAIADGGGAGGAYLTNCLVIDNRVTEFQGEGGGTYACNLFNCTVAFNYGYYPGIYPAPDAPPFNVQNCIIYDNTSSFNTNWLYGFYFKNCCTFPLPTGYGNYANFTNDPLFINLTNDFQLQSNSPCINAGNNTFISSATDLDGNPRIQGGTVDIGAYEYQTPTSVISYAWLQQYGLPTDGSVDFTNLDGTSLDVYQDWIAGLNPTNPASVLVMLSPTATNNVSGITVSWQSVSGILYDLQRSTNLAAPAAFSTIQTGIIGQAGTTSYTDTSATNNSPYFYQVGASGFY
jgi:hypothetical protein